MPLHPNGRSTQAVYAMRADSLPRYGPDGLVDLLLLYVTRPAWQQQPPNGCHFTPFGLKLAQIATIDHLLRQLSILDPLQTGWHRHSGFPHGVIEEAREFPPMKPIPLVRKAALAPAVSYLAGEGVPVNRYLRRAKILAPTPETLESLMPLHQVCDFLSSVAREQGLDDLGFRIAGQLGIEILGSFWRLISRALTFHESIQISREFISAYKFRSANLD